MGTSTVSNKKRGRATKSALAIALALALALGGTFATFYGTQMGQDRARELAPANPGGRVHDEFGNKVKTGTVTAFDKNIFAESFPDREGNGEYLIARIRLSEYMEINTDAMSPGSATGANKSAGTYGDYSTYAPVTFDGTTGNLKSNLTFNGAANPNVTVTLGKAAEAYRHNYASTFNRTTDGARALQVDVQGSLGDKYAGYPASVISGTNTAVPGTAYYGSGDVSSPEYHSLRQTSSVFNGVITLTKWKELKDGGQDTSGYWVFDEGDPANGGGWFYWTGLIAPDAATGLLLDSLSIDCGQLDWFYEMNVEGEFVTPDEVKAVETTPEGGGGATTAYYWKSSTEDGKAQIALPSEDVYNLVSDIKSDENPANYEHRISNALKAAALFKDAADAASLAGSEVDLSLEGNADDAGATDDEKELKFYVMARDEEGKRALVMAKYADKDWAADGTGLRAYDADGGLNWRDSDARAWCNDDDATDGEEGYLEALPARLKVLIPEVTIECDTGPANAHAGDLCATGVDTAGLAYTKDRIFLPSRGDLYGDHNGSSCNDFTTSLGLIGNRTRPLMNAKLIDGTTAVRYWNRTSCLANGTTYGYAVSLTNGMPSIEANPLATAAVRPMFWVNYN